jgi:hypothetical protein
MTTDTLVSSVKHWRSHLSYPASPFVVERSDGKYDYEAILRASIQIQRKVELHNQSPVLELPARAIAPCFVIYIYPDFRFKTPKLTLY